MKPRALLHHQWAKPLACPVILQCSLNNLRPSTGSPLHIQQTSPNRSTQHWYSMLLNFLYSASLYPLILSGLFFLHSLEYLFNLLAVSGSSLCFLLASLIQFGFFFFLSACFFFSSSGCAFLHALAQSLCHLRLTSLLDRN